LPQFFRFAERPRFGSRFCAFSAVLSRFSRFSRATILLPRTVAVIKAMHLIRSLIITAALSATIVFAAEPVAVAAKPDPWKALRPLLGKWEGEVAGEPGTGKAEREYAFTLNDRFIHVANKSIYPPQEKNKKGETHEDVGFVSYDKAAKKLVLRQFHVEGFVNHYVLDSISEDGRTIVFETTAIENIMPGFRGRETYRILNDDEFVETFAMAEPGKEFATYSETRFKRKKG
jgi:hypothetical protein